MNGDKSIYEVNMLIIGGCVALSCGGRHLMTTLGGVWRGEINEKRIEIREEDRVHGSNTPPCSGL